MFLDRAGQSLPDASLVGPLAAGVPGSPRGYFELHRRFGRLPWRDVVAPAIRLARDGFVVTERLHRDLVEERELLAAFAETAAVWLPGGEAPLAGSTLRLPRLAAALEAYARQGPEALTTGPLAEALVATSRQHGGVLTLRDVADYRPVWREPLRFRAFGWEVASMPLPSSGGVILGQTCGVLERLGWAGLPAGGADRVHLLAETWRRAFADRVLLGDPTTSRATPAQLLDGSWLDRRAGEIDRQRATRSAEVRPWPGEAGREHGETTHLSVVDGAGNAVSLTTTINGSFGCGLLVPETEILLNNEMDDFATAPGRPNQFGLIQGEANSVAPGKRMLSSMAPTIAWRGKEVLALGSPGGSRIPTATAQVLLAVLVDGTSLQAAVERPRVHHQWQPDELQAEAGALTAEQSGELERRGHLVTRRDRIGEVPAAHRFADGRLEAAADPRGPGAAAVRGPSDHP
jgi:gamma-glutamyltranspeptidase/glutathione hydrolase